MPSESGTDGHGTGRSAAEPVGGSSHPPPELRRAARALFGDRLPLATRYAGMLMTAGVVRGLIGPREAPRVWDRHLLNSAAVVELIADTPGLVDVGSGAGLPGVPLALAAPDLRVTLVEPMARRVSFLQEVIEALSLSHRVTVVRARAEEAGGQVPPVGVVVARALAPLDRLVRWCLPLVVPGGRVLAVKGASAAEEIAAHTSVVRRLGGEVPVLRRCGTAWLEEPTTVVEVLRRR